MFLDLEGKLPVINRSLEDSNATEYRQRLQEGKNYRYLCVVRILNRGEGSAENIRILLSEKPHHVDTHEKIGIDVKEFQDGIYQIEVRSLSPNGYATIVLFGPSLSIRNFTVEHQGIHLPQERTMLEEKRWRKNRIESNIFYCVMIMILLAAPVFLIFFSG